MTPALAWLEPLRSSVPELDADTWSDLCGLSRELARRVAAAPPLDGPGRSRWLLDLRRHLADYGHHAPAGPSGPVWQTLAQFCAGVHDLDLRDATGTGHGAMILTDAAEVTAETWRARLDRGELVGIAATERHGGSRLQEITTRARLHRDGRWRVNGEKCWVSRLVESAGFVVFFRDPDSRITAVVIDAANEGLEREPIAPFGLGGWSWGVLRLHDVPVDPATDLLGRAGDGLAVFRRHFARFRPLVTATALGTAAGMHTLVADALAARHKAGVLPRVRDNALITLGRTHAEITAALLATITTSRLAMAGHPHADLAARVGKAAGIDTAHRAITDLAPLLGAWGFQQASPIAKARADITGLLYADGVHDSLYRSGGLSLLDASMAASTPPSTGHLAAVSATAA
ncbi:acyl-CoA dehydrogenase family protein [Micromonospora sp. WMMD1082]|uniref:acyl-CoA dehydrogenase family protein n=1 Tax=Micromonospora sp. WMMD1082 TaxID=3016104 RepID=UPI002417F12A|nr:acyl-CoA dehydrogenase family protein [Micromonospora sp. WMMD1082]MDG4794979.1 acyl-CoA dehydrogenase family protein [Micromonospora sp. WMMD1082]